MDRTSTVFWSIIAVLFGASTFYGLGVLSQVHTTHRAAGSLVSGDIVQLAKVIDGDTVLVEKDEAESVIVRILGIKAFESKIQHDVTAAYGRAAEEALGRAGERPLRVLLNNPAKDRRGRTLATLFSGDQDVGLRLVRDGLALVYTVYPFPAMPLYLNAQEQARTEQRGLWADREVRERAEAIMREWQRQTP